MVAPRNGAAASRPKRAPWWRGLRGSGGPWSPRWLLWPARPALLVALLGLAGLAVTQPLAPYPGPGEPPPAGPIRYDAGAPLADRLVIIFAPTLDGPGVAALGAALRQGYAEHGAGGVAQFAVTRPQYAAFADATLLILAGNAPPAGSDPPDTLVRVIDDRAAIGTGRPGQGAAALVGPDDWRALFGRAPEPRLPDRPTAATPAAAARVTLAAAETALRERAPLTAIYLEEVATREPGGELAALGRQLDEGDTLLVVGGGGGLGTPLAGLLSGPAVQGYPVGAPPRLVALNDLAPTCAVLLGVGYPSEARGRITWPLLVADERHKAVATAALARQRTTLAAHSLPLGTLYPQLLRQATDRLPQIDGLIEQGQYAYAYQLASSGVAEADRALADAASAAVYAPPRRAAWPLVALCLAAALLAPALAAARRDARPLVGAALGLLLAAGCWAALVALLRGAVVARLPVVAALLTAPAIAGAGVGLWLGRERIGRGVRRAARLWRQGRRPQPRGRTWPAVESLVLLAALPAAICAYRYGYPWGLRLEETVSLFRWRSALLAPTMALLAAGAWHFLPPALSRLRARSSRPRPPEVGVGSVNLRENP